MRVFSHKTYVYENATYWDKGQNSASTTEKVYLNIQHLRLMLGIIVFHIAKFIQKNTRCTWGLSVEILSIMFLIVSLYKNYRIPRVQIVLFIVFLSIVYSQKVVRVMYNMKMTNFLGNFSMIMYFAHPVDPKIVLDYLKDSSNNVLIYSILAFVFTVLLYFLDRFFKSGRFVRKSEER